jgi:Ca-activated chloride channel family protein
VTTRGRASRGLAVAILAVSLLATACGGDDADSEPMDQATAEQELLELAGDVGWQSDPVTRKANVPPPAKDLADTLPNIDEFPVVVAAQAGANQVVAEVFVSTEKSGQDTDGWMAEVARSFNDSTQTLSDGREAKVAIRSIPSGTGYQFIAAGESLPAGFSPSNQLWVEMANAHRPMTAVRVQTVPNVAGIVMKTETADLVRTEYGTLDTSTLIEAVIAGDVVMGYTDPFASSTGLNFLLTVLDDFADGQEERLVAPDVASVFEQFQRQVPFVALTTLQIRESVEKESGTLDAFVMEYQTYVQTESLRSGYEFIPFGVRHDNPLYGVDGATSEQLEVLELFATHAESQEFKDKAADYGFNPSAYQSDVSIPSGRTLIEAQQLWKDKKDGGRPVYAVFVTDVSGSMSGSRIAAVQIALESAREFISPDASVGMVEFSDLTRKRLEVADFDLNQQARFAAATQDMNPVGGTAMYDGIVVGLSMLVEQRTADPSGKYLLVVLTDGKTKNGLSYDDVAEVVAGVRIPVFTVGFEADIDELARLASLVEAANINASEGNVEFKLASLFNAEV